MAAAFLFRAKVIRLSFAMETMPKKKSVSL